MARDALHEDRKNRETQMRQTRRTMMQAHLSSSIDRAHNPRSPTFHRPTSSNGFSTSNLLRRRLSSLGSRRSTSICAQIWSIAACALSSRLARCACRSRPCSSCSNDSTVRRCGRSFEISAVKELEFQLANKQRTYLTLKSRYSGAKLDQRLQ